MHIHHIRLIGSQESVKEYVALVEAVKDRTRRVDGMRKVAEIAVNIKTDALPKHFDLKQLGRYGEHCVVLPPSLMTFCSYYITEGPVKVAKPKKSEKELYWCAPLHTRGVPFFCLLVT